MNMEKRNLICIGCPMGCPLEVTLENGEVISVTGNTCRRGEIYGRKEVTNPTRIVTSSVKVSGSTSGAATVSVKTERDIPKDKIFQVIHELKGVSVPCPVNIGDVILSNAADTGVNIVATKNVE